MKQTNADPTPLGLPGRGGALRPLDFHFAHWMGRLAGSDDPALLLAAALASRQAGEGDVCVDLAAYAGRPLFPSPKAGEAPIQAPGLGAWRSALRAAAVVGAPGDVAPLILDRHDRLYLGRYWRFEQDLAEALRLRIGRWVPDLDLARLRTGLDRLFPAGAEVDWQKVATALAVLKPFCVISGGPGTGKTRTVTAILALLLEQADVRPLRIALAAPTGKAAARLTESVRCARGQLGLATEILDALPTEASTLHRLLGFRPGRSRPRHDAGNPLHLDVLAVDEASMVDLPLMARLLAALRPTTRLILLGDKDQLASVEAGMVLGDICGRGRDTGYSPELCAALSKAAGVELESGRPLGGSGERRGLDGTIGGTRREDVEPLLIADHLAVLRRSYRFEAHSGIGAVARAVNAGDGTAAVQALTAGAHPDALLETVGERGMAGFLQTWLVPRFAACLQAGAPGQILSAFNGFRILCAVREGPFGVRALNRLCETVLEGAGLIPSDRRDHYPGRPLLVTSNDYALGLYNGDVGMILPEGLGQVALRAWFETTDGLRRVLPPRLPAHETVFAMTVHKSQGSEFEDLVLVLPEAESRVLTRELLYTGITRARRQVLVVGPAGAVLRAAEARVNRASGLYEAIR